jgi:hypothetical protein
VLDQLSAQPWPGRKVKSKNSPIGSIFDWLDPSGEAFMRLSKSAGAER